MKPSVITLADRARDRGQWEVAAEYYQDALHRNPENPPIWVQYGHALKESGHLAKAEKAYRTALTYDPAAADSHLQLGHVLKLQGKLNEAEAMYLRSFVLDPSTDNVALEMASLGWDKARIAELERTLPPSTSASLITTYNSNGIDRDSASPAANRQAVGDGLDRNRTTRAPSTPSLATSRELIAESGLFDSAWYLSQNSDVAAAGTEPLTHYLAVGSAEGRYPNPLFDPQWYRAQNPDVAAAGVEPLAHYVATGAAEGRRPSRLFNPSWYHARNPDVAATGMDPLAHCLSTGEPDLDEYADWIRLYDTIGEDDRKAIAAAIGKMKNPPLISVIMPVYEVPEIYLRAAIESVRDQLYPHWELCIADDASKAPHVRHVLEYYRGIDARIKVCYRIENGHISAATNSALALAEGSFVALLDHDDELREHALYVVAARLDADPQIDLIYSDEDRIDADGRRYNPYFKSDWNLD